MPIPVGSADTGGTVTEDTTITRSFTTINGTNSALVVFIPYYNGSGTRVVSSVAWGATSLSRISGNPGTPTSDDHAAEIWAAALGASHTGATNNVVVTFSGLVVSDIIIQQFDAVDQASLSHDGGREPTTDSGTASISIANCVSSDYLLGTFTKSDATNAYTPGGSPTVLHEALLAGLSTKRVIAFYRTGVSGTQTVSATFLSTNHGGAGAALKDAPSATSTVSITVTPLRW